jgi:adenylate cyclase
VRRAVRGLANRFFSIADEPTDDDDLRLGKRIAVGVGYFLGIGAFVPAVLAPGVPVSWAFALALSAVSAVNLAVLARTRRFDRYVVTLLVGVTLLPAFVDLALGGLAASSGGFVFSLMGPLFAILAVGPRRATRWLVFFLLVLASVIALDPIVSISAPPQPYGLRLIFWAQNLSVPLVIVFFLLRYSDLRRREAQALAEELLTNAIPVSIAARLKRGERRIAEVYAETTVLFADLVGFTPWAGRTDPDRVVSFLDSLFSRFDALAAAAGVEKIKTIGDSYMAVAGAPIAMADHAQAAMALARGMLVALAEARTEASVDLEVRIGLASGSVVGGVIGQRRILFDLWGDTVNLASRMESSGVPGRIQVAPSTRALLSDGEAFEERKGLDVKGLGVMTAYLVQDAR